MRILALAVALMMGCGGGDSGDPHETADAAIDALPDAAPPTCDVDGTRSCPDLGYSSGPTVAYTCSDHGNPVRVHSNLSCIDPAGTYENYCCCAQSYPGQPWPCAN